MRRFNQLIRELSFYKRHFLKTRDLPHFCLTALNDGQIQIGDQDRMDKFKDEGYRQATPEGMSEHEWLKFVWGTICGGGDKADLHSIGRAWSIEGMFADGIKMFCPTIQECESLSKIDLTFDLSEYRQPFGTFVVAIPDGFLPDTVECRDSQDIKSVSCIIGRYCQDKKVLSLSVFGSSFNNEPTLDCVHSLMPGRPVESIFQTKRHECKIYTDYEEESNFKMRRIFLNACQILTQCGMRKVGFANPADAAKLQAKIDTAPRAMRRAAQRELETLPMVYGFDQHIRLFDTEGPASDHGGDGTRTLHPHWRRGHWRNQPHGPRNELRKLAFVRPCFVNPHLFAGDKFDTRVSMSVAE